MNSTPTNTQSLKSAWIGLLFLALFAVAVFLPHHIQPQLPFPTDVPFGESPRIPWSTITRHFLDGLFAAALLAIVIPLGIIFFKRCWPYSFMTIWMSLLMTLPRVIVLIMILLKTEHLLEPTKATSEWLSSDEFLKSYSFASHATIICFGVVLLTVKNLINTRVEAQRRRENAETIGTSPFTPSDSNVDGI